MVRLPFSSARVGRRPSHGGWVLGRGLLESGRSDYELAVSMFKEPPKLLDIIRRLLRALVYAQ